jgi:hypothetical protein
VPEAQPDQQHLATPSRISAFEIGIRRVAAGFASDINGDIAGAQRSARRGQTVEHGVR